MYLDKNWKDYFRKKIFIKMSNFHPPFFAAKTKARAAHQMSAMQNLS
jgi:hypothetical protein